MTNILLKKSNDKNRVVSNILSLGVLQGFNSILPLLTLPYLVRVIGIDYFGLLAFANAAIAYFSLITDFGFSLTATREISLNRNDYKKVIEIYSSVLTIKFGLLLISLLMLILLGLIFPKFGNDFNIFILSFGLVFGNMLFPQWFFQGIEKMKYVTYFNVGAKTFYTILIFVFVKNQSDYYLVPLLNSLGFILSGIISQIIVYRHFKVKFEKQKLIVLKKYFKESFKVFKGTFSYSAIAPTTIFLTGSFFGNVIVGYYSAIEKLFRGIAYVASPVAQGIFPYLAKSYMENPKKTLQNSIKISTGFLIITISISIVLGYYANTILSFLYKEDFVTSFTLNTYYILLFFPPLYGIVHTYCTQNLLIMKKYDTYGYVLLSAFIISIISYLIFMIFLGKMAIPVTVVFIELYIASMLIYFIIKYKKQIL
jgi:O-antigen/teichoic acid export membrane protein